MTRYIPFQVDLWPCGVCVEVESSDVVSAAAYAQTAIAANCATVRRTDHDSSWGEYSAMDEVTVYFDDHPVAVHFVNFRDEYSREYTSAARLFGPPDFFHKKWDRRAMVEAAPWDVLIFARGDPSDAPAMYTVDDSNEPDDPAAWERR